MKDAKEKFFVISNYNNNTDWVLKYTENYVIYDRSDDGHASQLLDPEKIIKSPNIGYNLYDYFTFIIDNYEKLPEVVVFAKGNVFPRHVREDQFNKIIKKDIFTPIEEAGQLSTVPLISFLDKNVGYNEINNSWYVKKFKTKYFNSYNSFINFCFQDIKSPLYVKFAPGANYIVPRENILKLPKQFYENLRLFISHDMLTGEAHIIERALFTLWTTDNKINPEMLKSLGDDFVNTKIKNKQNLRGLRQK